jgi:hypothetical protein
MFGLCVPALIYSGSPIGIGAKDVLQAIGPQTISGLIAVAAGFVVEWQFLADSSHLTRIFASGMVCLLAYLAICVGLFRVTAPLRLVFSVLRELRAVRTPAGLRS